MPESPARRTAIAAAFVAGAASGGIGAVVATPDPVPEVVTTEDSESPCQTEVRLSLGDADWGEVYPGCGETAPTERGAPEDLRFCVGARPASMARDGEPTLCAE